MSQQVWRLSIHSQGTSVDELSGALYLAGYEGIEILEDPASPGATTVRAYALARNGLEELARVAAQVPGCTLGTIEEIGVEDWAEGWRKHFQPVEVGAVFVVLPPWEKSGEHGGRIPLVIDPGHAFGTGTHASTQLVLVALPETVARLPAQGPVVDLGTGSGILAIAAMKLGLAPVTAVEVDPEALDEARRNARANKALPYLTFVEGDQHEVPDGTRLVLANLSAPIHRAIARLLADRLAPGGSALLSGLLADESDGVAKAWPAGWVRRRLERDGWALLELVRPAS